MRVAIVGEGVIGISTASVLVSEMPDSHITIFSDAPFEKSCSFGPAGLFRLDKFEYKDLARRSFAHFEQLHRDLGGVTGIQLISGHIQSDNLDTLRGQERNFGDIVYNFRFLEQRELAQFVQPSKYCIHYTAFTTEGRVYVPWMKKALIEKGVEFVQRRITTLDELSDEFDVIVNCAGIEGGRVAGDDSSVYPIRGISFEIEAPWHKHFLYRDFTTFTIPMTSSVLLGSVKQAHRSDLRITDADREDILGRYYKLHPAIKTARIIGEWSGLRPERDVIRLEAIRRTTASGRPYLIVHNYGHGGNGFTLSWGSAERVRELIHAHYPSRETRSHL